MSLDQSESEPKILCRDVGDCNTFTAWIESTAYILKIFRSGVGFIKLDAKVPNSSLQLGENLKTIYTQPENLLP